MYICVYIYTFYIYIYIYIYAILHTIVYTTVFNYSVLLFLIVIYSYSQRRSCTLYSYADVIIFI